MSKARLKSFITFCAILFPFFYVVHAEFFEEKKAHISYIPAPEVSVQKPCIPDTIIIAAIPDTIKLPGKTITKKIPVYDTIQDSVFATSLAYFDTSGVGVVKITNTNKRVQSTASLKLKMHKPSAKITPIR